MERGLITANAAGKKRGEEFVERLTPTGGTNINDSLVQSLKQFEKGDRPKMLVFMTDGLPTVGETNVDKIIANLKIAKTVDVRISRSGLATTSTRLCSTRSARKIQASQIMFSPRKILRSRFRAFSKGQLAGAC
ncbi:MAG: hypothetical protein IPK98_16675 [Chloracidobacterium sp.]|nr:hypothetical protein [Chloracidobacterium sp.]